MSDIINKVFTTVRRGSFESYLSLIEKVDVNIRNEFKQSLLEEAITCHKKDIIFDLINRGINVNLQDYRGDTALHFLGEHDDPIVAEMVLKRGGRLDLYDKYANSPLWTAAFNANGHYETVELFLRYGADPLHKNKVGRSPLDIALRRGDKILIDLLEGAVK